MARREDSITGTELENTLNMITCEKFALIMKVTGGKDLRIIITLTDYKKTVALFHSLITTHSVERQFISLDDAYLN
jgi:hypothetical protein